VIRELEHAARTEREVLEQRAAANQTVIRPEDRHTIELNCENINTGYQLAVETHNQLVASPTQNLVNRAIQNRSSITASMRPLRTVMELLSSFSMKYTDSGK
jgi:hypothetical protein